MIAQISPCPHAERISALADAMIDLRETYGAATTHALLARGFSHDELDAYGDRARDEAARRDGAPIDQHGA